MGYIGFGVCCLKYRPYLDGRMEIGRLTRLSFLAFSNLYVRLHNNVRLEKLVILALSLLTLLCTLASPL